MNENTDMMKIRGWEGGGGGGGGGGGWGELTPRFRNLRPCNVVIDKRLSISLPLFD